MYGTLAGFQVNLPEKENTSSWLSRMQGRRLVAPKMCEPRMSLPEWMVKSSEVRKDVRRLPPLQNIMPSGSVEVQSTSWGRRRSRNSTCKNPKPSTETQKASSSKHQPLSQELERRKNKHPRLRWPRLAMSEHHDPVSEAGTSGRNSPIPSARSNTGIVQDRFGAKTEYEDMMDELESVTHQYLQEIESNVDVIGPGSLFYPGFDVPVEPKWPEFSKQRDDASSGIPPLKPLPAVGEDPAVEEDEDAEPALLERARAHQGLAVGNYATVHLPRLDGTFLDHRARAKKGDTSVRDRKYHIRQAPFSHIMAMSSVSQKAAGGSSSSTSPPRSDRNQSAVQASKAPTSEYLDFQSWGIDDQYVTLLCNRAKLESIRFINMADNRLTADSINLMATSKVSWKLESLQLGGNKLGERGGRALCRFFDAVRPPLRQLDLSENLIGDKACEELCETIVGTGCSTLQGLTLARNQLGHGEKVGASLGFFVSASRELEVLDLHWNFFYGAGATALFNGIYENGCNNGGKLRRLNLAWNRLGTRCGDHLSTQAAAANSAASPARRASSSTGGGEAPAARRASAIEAGGLGARPAPKAKQVPLVACTCAVCSATTRAAKMLSSILQDGQVLFHLDLSYNSIGAADCGILGDGLKRNHTLFGLHLTGNEATVDELGFVVPLKPGEYDKHSEMREKANRLVENIPSKLRIDLTPLVLHERKQGLSSVREQATDIPGYSSSPSPTTAGRATTDVSSSVGLFGGYRMNPSLRSLAPSAGRGMLSKPPTPFSNEDIQVEKTWVAVHSQAQQPLDFGSTEVCEDVRRNARCCWVCENWVEQRVSYIPGWSGSEQSADEVLAVYAFFSLDGFTRPTKLARVEEPFQRRLFDAERHGRMRQFGRSDTKGRVNITRGTVCLGRRPLPCLTENGRVVRWTGSRMLPPTTVPVQVVFQVNDQITVADDMPIHNLEVKKAVRLQPFGDGTSSVNSLKGTAQSFFNGRVGTAEGAPDGTVTMATCEVVNNMTIAFSAWERFELGEATALIVLEDPLNRGQINVLPRRFQEEAAPRPLTAWSFEKSVWASYMRDPENMGCHMFEHDWANTKLSAFVRNTRVQDSLYSYLRKHYLPMVFAYHYYAFYGYKSNRYAAGLPLLAYTDVLSVYGGVSAEAEGSSAGSSRPNTNNSSTRGGNRRPMSQEMQKVCTSSMSDSSHASAGVCLFDKHFHFRNADTIFVASAVLDKEKRRKFFGLPEKGLTRFQFLEAVVRVASARFVDSGEKEDVAGAVKEFNKCFKMGQDLLELRKTLQKDLFNEECDMVFKEYHHMLEAVYISYKPLHSYPGRQGGGLSFGAWTEMLHDAGATDAGISHREFGAAFALGKELRVDEFTNMRHMELSWSEFLVCLGALLILREDYEAAFFADMLADFFADCISNANQSHLDGSQNKSGWDKDGSISSVVHLVGKVFRDADENNSGQLSLREFRRCMNQPAVQQEVKDLGIEINDINTFYSKLDQDGSGDVTADELCEGFIKMKLSMKGLDRAVVYMRRAFTEADADKSGLLSIQEFKNLCGNPSVLKRLGALGIAEPEVEAMVEQLTMNGDTKSITVDEMVAGFLNVREKGLGESRGINVLRQLFTEADTDSSNNLTRTELRRAFCTEKVSKKLQSLQLKEPDWIGIFDALDTDKSGEVSWAELCGGMRQFWKQALEQDVHRQAKNAMSGIASAGGKTRDGALAKSLAHGAMKPLVADAPEVIAVPESSQDEEASEEELEHELRDTIEAMAPALAKDNTSLSASNSASTMTPSASAVSLATTNQSPPP